MTIFRSIEVDTFAQPEVIEEDLQKKISEIEKKEDAQFITFSFLKSGGRLSSSNAKIETTVFMAAFSKKEIGYIEIG